MEILTIDHKRFDEFVTRLKGPEGYNFRMEGKVEIHNAFGKEDRNSIIILEQMGGIDIEATMAYFEEKCGSRCDAEILMYSLKIKLAQLEEKRDELSRSIRITRPRMAGTTRLRNKRTTTLGRVSGYGNSRHQEHN